MTSRYAGNAVALTPQQGKVMQYLVEGKTPKEIAQLLHLQRNTVRKHIVRVRVRLGARTLPHCIALLIRYQLLSCQAGNIDRHREPSGSVRGNLGRN